MKLDTLKTRLENQIEEILNTTLEIEKLEQKEPWRELSNWHKTTLWMIFFNQVLMPSCWNNILKNKGLTQEQQSQYILEVAEMTKSHYRNLYWYDTIETANKI